jgi:hypothetical protein
MYCTCFIFRFGLHRAVSSTHVDVRLILIHPRKRLTHHILSVQGESGGTVALHEGRRRLWKYLGIVNGNYWRTGIP